jgi:hypothetical protein
LIERDKVAPFLIGQSYSISYLIGSLNVNDVCYFQSYVNGSNSFVYGYCIYGVCTKETSPQKEKERPLQQVTTFTGQVADWVNNDD